MNIRASPASIHPQALCSASARAIFVGNHQVALVGVLTNVIRLAFGPKLLCKELSLSMAVAQDMQVHARVSAEWEGFGDLLIPLIAGQSVHL
ncbi:hypothetical protein HDV05_006061 [Chytridiales sp. JEL 0842]|nr:hypothetical protein HDV05_006061 [Chytridiales sp. JEL 0842]